MFEKAKQLLEDSHYDEHGFSDSMRQEAAICAQLAIVEELRALRFLLENRCEVSEPDEHYDPEEIRLNEEYELAKQMADDEDMVF